MQARPLKPTPMGFAVDKPVSWGPIKASTSSGHVCMTREQIACLAPSVKTYARLYPPNRGFIQAL